MYYIIHCNLSVHTIAVTEWSLVSEEFLNSFQYGILGGVCGSLVENLNMVDGTRHVPYG